MEHWTDQGIVLSARPYGEGGAIVSLLTENHGRHAGYVYGGMSGRKRSLLDAGTQVKAQWSARLSDSLGVYQMEIERNLPLEILENSKSLSALLSACSLCDETLPEREGHSGLYYGLLTLMDILQTEHWGAGYVMWEISLLRELGFPLDLTRCAGGGKAEDIMYVSPKSGRGVSKSMAGPYKEKLLLLPNFLRPESMRDGVVADSEDIALGLKMTSYFLEHWAYAHHAKGLPQARDILLSKFHPYP